MSIKQNPHVVFLKLLPFYQCSANVVVMMDNHWNPTIAHQSIARAHRLGQKKPVYCFRLAIQNSIEDKIYARSVNKDGVVMQVVDGNFSEMPYSFTEAETQNLQAFDVTKICSKCDKKRRLIDQEFLTEDHEWICPMNSDQRYSKCSIPEEKGLDIPRRGPLPVVENPILEHVLGVINGATRRTVLVADYIPAQITHHEKVSCQDAIERLNRNESGISKTQLVSGDSRKTEGSTILGVKRKLS